jgi:hypothetical protein
MLHKDYDRKGSVAKRKRLVVSPWLAVNHQSSSNSDSGSVVFSHLVWLRGLLRLNRC